jgi:hypothetical protein
MATDISLRDLNNSDLRVATSVDGNPRDREKNAGLQRWDYPDDLVSTFGPPGAPTSRDSSLHGGDTAERQVSGKIAASSISISCWSFNADVFCEGVWREGSTVVSLVESGALCGEPLSSISITLPA